GIPALMRLASAVPEKSDLRSAGASPGFIVRLGTSALKLRSEIVSSIAFLGEVSAACIRLLRGRARMQARDVFLYIDECGPQALPIITLISTLVGLILAFIGAIQLAQFG